MSILFIDLECSGLPEQEIKPNGRKFFYPYQQIDKFDSSRILQFSFINYTPSGQVLSIHNHFIKPTDFIISQESINIHHITPEIALKKGIDLSDVLNEFEEQLDKSKLIVMHNVWFDRTILLSEAYRLNKLSLVNKIYKKPYFCTMRETKNFCKLPSQYYDGYKNPKLIELHQKLFKNEVINPNILHNALNDVKITAKCFFKLLSRGKITILN